MELDEWLARAAAELGLPAPDAHQVHALLDLARDAAHGVARPAAPLTTFLVGMAVGRGATLDEASGRVTALLPEPGSPDSPH